MARTKRKTYRFIVTCKGQSREVIANNKGHACHLAFTCAGRFPFQKPRTYDGGWEGVQIECLREEKKGSDKRAIVPAA